MMCIPLLTEEDPILTKNNLHIKMLVRCKFGLSRFLGKNHLLQVNMSGNVYVKWREIKRNPSCSMTYK